MQRKTERRLELLRAARGIFATRGYHEAKVDDIVAAAKVAKGTFYLYFRDKRSVFVELVDTLFTRLGAAILRVDPASDVEAQIRHNIRAILAVLLDDPETTLILMSHAAGLDPAFSAKIDAFYAGAKKLLTESLREGQRLGIVGDGDARLYATFTLGALKEVLLEMISSKRPIARERVVAELFALAQRGYLRIEGGGKGGARGAVVQVAGRLAPAGSAVRTRLPASGTRVPRVAKGVRSA